MKWEIWRSHAGKILADLQNRADGEEREDIILFLPVLPALLAPNILLKGPSTHQGQRIFWQDILKPGFSSGIVNFIVRL